MCENKGRVENYVKTKKERWKKKSRNIEIRI